jgi:uncharacterized membrane protein YuzA (DUF378 family)
MLINDVFHTNESIVTQYAMLVFDLSTGNKKTIKTHVCFWKKHYFFNSPPMMGKGWCSVHKVAWVLVWVGALNWGLIGFFDWNLVHTLLGSVSGGMLESIVYMLVGLSAIASLFCENCKMCKK